MINSIIRRFGSTSRLCIQRNYGRAMLVTGIVTVIGTFTMRSTTCAPTTVMTVSVSPTTISSTINSTTMNSGHNSTTKDNTTVLDFRKHIPKGYRLIKVTKAYGLRKYDGNKDWLSFTYHILAPSVEIVKLAMQGGPLKGSRFVSTWEKFVTAEEVNYIDVYTLQNQQEMTEEVREETEEMKSEYKLRLIENKSIIGLQNRLIWLHDKDVDDYMRQYSYSGSKITSIEKISRISAASALNPIISELEWSIRFYENQAKLEKAQLGALVPRQSQSLELNNCKKIANIQLQLSYLNQLKQDNV